MAGLTSTGFEIKTTEELREELADELKAELGNVNTQADSILGIIIGVVAGRLGSLWELGQSLYRAFDPDTSTGDALDGLAALTGTTRAGASPSTLVAAVDLDADVTLPAGSRATVDGAPGRVFETIAAAGPQAGRRRWHQVEMQAVDDGPVEAEEGTLTEIATPVSGWNAIVNEPVPGVAWSTAAEPFALDDADVLNFRIPAGGSTQTFTFLTADFASIGAATAQEIVDVINDTIVDGVASVEDGRVKITTDDAGADATIRILSHSAGLFAVGTNYGIDGTAAELGTLEETDAELRSRRAGELERQGTSTGESLRARLLELDGMLDVSVYQNRTDDTDGNGLPPHSFRAVVFGTNLDNDEIARVIFENSPLGIQSYGNESAQVEDSQGTQVTVSWDVATEIPVYIEATISAIASSYAGDDAVKAALLEYVGGLRMGDDVIAEAAKGRLFQAGVYDVTAWLIDDVAAPVAATNIAIGLDEVATLDEGDIDLTVNFVTPS